MPAITGRWNEREPPPPALRTAPRSTPPGPSQERIESDDRHFETLLDVLHRHASDVPLLVRLAFVGGNLCATSARARTHLAPATPLLLDKLASHTAALTAAPTADGAAGKDGGVGLAERMDALVKLIRFIAHLAIDPHAAQTISTAPQAREITPLPNLACSSRRRAVLFTRLLH